MFRTSYLSTACALCALIPCSCQTPETGRQQTPTGPKPGSDDWGGKKGIHRTAAWSDAGVDHNKLMRWFDDSLAVGGVEGRFTSESAWMQWAIDLICDFAVDSSGYDEDEVQQHADGFWVSLPTPDDTSEWRDWIDKIDDLSSREGTYLYRLGNIMYAYGLTNSQMTDSLNAFKADVLAIGWENNEQAITPIMSIAWHRWDWILNEGFDDSDVNYPLWFDLGGMLKDDAYGAVGGWRITYTWQDAAAGAGIGSAVNAVCQFAEHYDWW